jgi:Asp-tRNA(Asn)/Glu-tRNA(Gln) amidotransferase A subunit family amidase
MPVRVQIVGHLNSEDCLFGFAAAVEKSLGGFASPPNR